MSTKNHRTLGLVRRLVWLRKHLHGIFGVMLLIIGIIECDLAYRFGAPSRTCIIVMFGIWFLALGIYCRGLEAQDSKDKRLVTLIFIAGGAFIIIGIANGFFHFLPEGIPLHHLF